MTGMLRDNGFRICVRVGLYDTKRGVASTKSMTVAWFSDIHVRVRQICLGRTPFDHMAWRSQEIGKPPLITLVPMPTFK